MNLNIKNLQSSKIIIFSMIIRQKKKPKIQIQNLVLLSSLWLKKRRKVKNINSYNEFKKKHSKDYLLYKNDNNKKKSFEIKENLLDKEKNIITFFYSYEIMWTVLILI